ncbi:unnamed protein product [Microthlaspi erraticum]|uniref:Uncharacterized protein n=1 Tax=Microthlaspi erraticum TaxID=1685480 RepID=A0A6D2KJ39_9BRAS|nr:unnamed protein product [Microthlaspi erraticum]
MQIQRDIDRVFEYVGFRSTVHKRESLMARTGLNTVYTMMSRCRVSQSSSSAYGFHDFGKMTFKKKKTEENQSEKGLSGGGKGDQG